MPQAAMNLAAQSLVDLAIGNNSAQKHTEQKQTRFRKPALHSDYLYD